VILEKDQVVDAVFRRPDREYTGVSSSPQSVSSIEAAAAARRPGTLRRGPSVLLAPSSAGSRWRGSERRVP
jgi:hypothetical protein